LCPAAAGGGKDTRIQRFILGMERTPSDLVEIFDAGLYVPCQQLVLR